MACGFDTGGVGTGSASVGGTASTTETGADDGPVTTNATAESSGPIDPTTVTDPSDSAESTITDADTGVATTSTTTASSATEAGESTTGEAAMVHHLQQTDQTACDEPLWCFVGDVFNEYGDPIYGQQCFTSPVPPPFELISVHYVVADVAPELTQFLLEVHGRDENGPTDTITFEQRPAADATPGSHEFVFDPPVQIADMQFCVGFATPYDGLAAGLGMAVDAGTTVSDVSFIRLEGPSGCSIPLWSDVIDDLDPTPSGNWCIDAQIRELP